MELQLNLNFRNLQSKFNFTLISPKNREESGREGKNSSNRQDGDLQQGFLLFYTESAEDRSVQHPVGNSHLERKAKLWNKNLCKIEPP